VVLDGNGRTRLTPCRHELLTATRERQDEQDGDFCFATEGELVLLGFVCAADEADPDRGCGCGRAFSGMSSLRATTTALVRDLDLSIDELRLALEGYYAAAGMGPDVIGMVVSPRPRHGSIEGRGAGGFPAGGSTGNIRRAVLRQSGL
jgi:hypothetical protein